MNKQKLLERYEAFRAENANLAYRARIKGNHDLAQQHDVAVACYMVAISLAQDLDETTES